NMATVATKRIVDLIEKKTVVRCLSLAGNFDIDKKPAWLNFINQRGYSAWAEVLLPKKTVEDTLKTTPEKIFEVWLAKCMIGSAISGSLGFNAHFANVVAAFYAAIGQDLAHVVEGSMGITIVKMMKNSDLYFSVYLPALLVGIIGGGTKLATKKEALAIIGAKTPEELVEVLAGTVLAGEISLLASLAEGSLAKAHIAKKR
ncbi:MAG: 3-hydroxy-3-methylglutaryl-CoA reductase, partial [Actinobacteria bacterium]|nr:3-hydroxy-3-methylglutaryl-CoA reductase [Actinomycetota bacterium]